MRLADFIDRHSENILGEWVAFARKQTGAHAMDLTALRDHAAEMLAVIAADLRTPQSAEQQHTKAHGEAQLMVGAPATAAESHGAGRADAGFTVAEMLSEFRALRASVLRLWTAANGTLTGVDIDDLMRFNEAIDQAIAESILRFNQSVDQSQDLFVAILGHDLRTPLQTVAMVNEHVVQARLIDAQHEPLMLRALRSVTRMTRMLDDVLDFTRIRKNAGLAVQHRDVDLAQTVQDAVDEFRTASPQRAFDVDITGDLHGRWDASRIGQVLANLLGNAVEHGSPTSPVRVTALGEDEQVVLQVCNDGPVIPEAELPTLFSPFKRLRNGGTGGRTHHLGLGLYIADQIVSAHGGRIVVESTEDQGTCFAAHLPRARTEGQTSR